MPSAQADGATIHYEVLGQGTPLVMALPQSAGPEGRETLLRGLAARHRVITYDQRGTGASSPSTRPMSIADQASDVLAVLDDAGVAAAHLFCHSTGCGIGLEFAAQHGRRVASLALLNPWTWGDPFLAGMQRLRIAAARALDPLQYSRFNAALLFPPEYRRRHAPGFVRLAERALDHPHDADEIERRLEAILAFDARPSLAEITAPSLVVSAGDDQLMPPWFAAEAAAALPRATLVELDGGGHMLTETRPEGVLDLVLAHFAESDTRAALE